MNPIGTITIWAGAIVDIPNGWALCDGTNGTPDLRGKFLKGAGPGDAVDGEGGSLTHDHEFKGDGHDHNIDHTVGTAGAGPELAWDGTYGSLDDDAEGTTDSASSLPPFYNLAYIQRMT